MNILSNGDFEADWSEERSHRCLMFPVDGTPVEQEIGNIFTPPGWLTWFRHQEGVWSQPECRDSRAKNPDRMHSGNKGFLLFTFSRRHDGGLLQQAEVEPGTRLSLSAWAHAWSNHKDASQPEKFPHPDESRWSEGAGFEPFFAQAGSVQNENLRNFTFWVGIDPTGGTNPFADAVVWGRGAHIYNAFHEVPPVEAVAQAGTVTVFLRSQTLWPFKHNDAYWDDASLDVVEQHHIPLEPLERGKPREPYRRVYVLLPADAGKEWAHAAIEATWERSGYTIGRSADDAGIGDLDQRIVIAVNPEQWGAGEDGTGLEGFYQKHYPGIEYRPVMAETAEVLEQKLRLVHP
jgi:hypothetical protein